MFSISTMASSIAHRRPGTAEQGDLIEREAHPLHEDEGGYRRRGMASAEITVARTLRKKNQTTTTASTGTLDERLIAE